MYVLKNLLYFVEILKHCNMSPLLHDAHSVTVPLIESVRRTCNLTGMEGMSVLDKLFLASCSQKETSSVCTIINHVYASVIYNHYTSTAVHMLLNPLQCAVI